jgi:diguanylate cyclase (GGDEF)-like protein/PAS domain S-box-containing protein
VTGNEREKIRHLLVIQDLEGQRIIPLEGATYSIGRDSRNSIVLNSKVVSRQHAILLRVTIPDSKNYLFRIVDGNLNGQRSKNGLLINGKKSLARDLQNGDIIVFGPRVQAKYYYFFNLVDSEFSEICKADDVSNFLASRISLYDTHISPDVTAIENSEAALVRLASFPELIPNPIIEVDITGNITYINPAAILKFPTLKEMKNNHPILSGLASSIKNQTSNAFVREVKVDREFFEQSVHYLPESDLIRIFIVDVTERKRAEEARRQAEERYRLIFENAVGGIFQTSLDGYYLVANPMLARIYGYDSPEDLMRSITDIGEQLYVDPLRRIEFVRQMRERGVVRSFESQVYRKDGSIIWISEKARPMYDANGQIIGYEGTVEDISDRKRAEEELRKRDRLLQSVAEAARYLLAEMNYEKAIYQAIAQLGEAAEVDTVYIVENHPHPNSGQAAMSLRYAWSRELLEPPIHQPHWKNRLYSDFNKSDWYGMLASGRAIKRTIEEFPVAEQSLLDLDNILSLLVVPIFVIGEVGSTFWGWMALADCQQERCWSMQEESTLFTMAASISSALLRQQTEETIRYRALHDLLTDLPNRTLFNEQLSLAIPNASRQEKSLAVMFLDLDRFKTINDTLGHTVGDRLLQSVAGRLKNCLRLGDIVARWGGDEFTILLPQIEDNEDATRAAQRIQQALDSVFTFEGHDLYITSSIGIALLDETGGDTETLIKNADTALYYAKEQGRNCYQFYNASMSTKAPERLTLEKRLRQALEKEEFNLVYQPRVEVATGHILGTEALIRWQSPEMGAVSPGSFIPVAEESGLIVSIGEWTLREACRQNKLWQQAGLAPICVAVNLSPLQFRQPKLVEMVAQILKETELEPQYLELEVTETTAIQDIDFTRRVLQELEQMGVRLAIDDFGTGHSSLSRLQLLPLHNLKIDRSFIQELTENVKVAHIVTAVVTLGQSLGLSIIAEGVEKAEELEFLKSINCDAVQGFFFYHPLSVEAATEILRQNQAKMINS